MKKKKKDINTQQPNKGINFNKQIQPYKTIKTSLKSIIKTPEIQKIINDLVLKCNDIVIDTYQFIRLYILHFFLNSTNIHQIRRFKTIYFNIIGKFRVKIRE